MANEFVNDIANLEIPFGREMLIQDVKHESGLQMMRIRLKEGSRFTIFDIDNDTVNKLKEILNDWTNND